MHFAGRPRHAIATMAAVLLVVAFAGVTLASRMGAAAATAGVVEEVPPAPTSTSTSSTTSSTSTSTSTSTTVKPKPTTTLPPRTTAPATTPPAPVVTQPPSTAAPAGTSAADRCAAAKGWVAQRGLVLPAGWGFRCPGPAIVAGASRWGLACWNCEGNNTNWIAIDVGRIGPSDAALRYVIAHETCHALEYTALGLSTEITADLCAALHGAPRP